MTSTRQKWEHQPLALQCETPNDENRMEGCWIVLDISTHHLYRAFATSLGIPNFRVAVLRFETTLLIEGLLRHLLRGRCYVHHQQRV